MTQARWKVGITQPILYSPAQRRGYGFSILNFHGAPLLSISYATEEESKHAEEAMRKAIENAADIMGYSGS